MSGRYKVLLIELCAEQDSALTALSPGVTGQCLAIRVTQNLDATKKATVKALHAVLRTAAHMQMSVHLWV